MKERFQTCDDPECPDCRLVSEWQSAARDAVAAQYNAIRRTNPRLARAIWKQAQEHNRMFEHYLRQMQYGPGAGSLH